MKSLFKRWIAQLRDGPVDWDELEATLLQCDLGLPLASKVLDELKKRKVTAAEASPAAEAAIAGLWPHGVRKLSAGPSPQAWLVVGVNGAGKTTTIAKLAARFQKQKLKVFLVGADTFRAGAMQQLRIWAERLGCPIYTGKEEGDPAAAAHTGIEEGRKSGADLILVDTSGRLHNKENLMREMEKIKRVTGRVMEGAPHETLLVIDGSNGANALQQAKLFHAALGLTGLVATKMDGTAKGGAVAAIKAELGLDTLLLGQGEGPGDLEDFDPQTFASAFF
jgi:fused signal recognition particle receptor